MTRVALEDQAVPATRDAVWEGLRAFNEAQSGPGSFASTPLNVVLRDESGAPVGGLIGRSYSGWLYVELFHLPEAQRRAGLGREMLSMAEREAAARGCIGVRLETYSFQAPGFYARMGYTVVGRLDDCPPGHTRFSLAKRLDGAPLEAP
ncbi:Acetyltransferase (GNAT) family protein [Roseomonas rosea]|jgi:GNAT superfamily N-acetyltransferase|uniref:Acetyltransferase (GNAT) family protein n=1 Tax=Muricoccus roseus TaxID=198092 RepID=A0A1M6MIE2_9PROT|nr:GNAT family N-acetyltransferase [Roseomonas rosea]SHJ83194.1 Acetyltransferase (GNAT) family protein [Roseomonas rosea]